VEGEEREHPLGGKRESDWPIVIDELKTPEKPKRELMAARGAHEDHIPGERPFLLAPIGTANSPFVLSRVKEP
jgi:hypothetical protein